MAPINACKLSDLITINYVFAREHTYKFSKIWTRFSNCSMAPNLGTTVTTNLDSREDPLGTWEKNFIVS